MRALPLVLLLSLCPSVGGCESKSPAAATASGPAPDVGVALFGAELDPKPGHPDVLDRDYVLPHADTLGYYSKKGFKTIRLPVNWIRLQPQVGGPLDATKLAELDGFLDLADSFGMRVVVDLHAYCRRGSKVLGTPDLPVDALASFWSQFARHFKGRFAGYDIMNEPHDMPNAQVWPQAAQLTVDAIRKEDPATTLYVEGDDWSSAQRWASSNATLAIKDPADHLVYSAHEYFDKDTSGQYRVSYDADGASPDVGARRLEPFVGWLRDHGAKGHIGEYGAPYADPRWVAVIDNFLDAVAANRDVLIGSSYWAGGQWADSYPLTIQPAKDGNWTDRPQMQVLLKPR
jgi:aryl-phospho-beta-D-glucosidase BglC (GH1 family)